MTGQRVSLAGMGNEVTGDWQVEIHIVESSSIEKSLIPDFINRLQGELARTLPVAIKVINSHGGINNSGDVTHPHLPSGFRNFLQTPSGAEILREFMETVRASRLSLHLVYPHLWQEIMNTAHRRQSPDLSRQLYFLALDWLEQNAPEACLELGELEWGETEFQLLVKLSELRPPDDLSSCQKEKACRIWKNQIAMVEMLSERQQTSHGKAGALTWFSRPTTCRFTEQSVVSLYHVLYELTDDPGEKLRCLEKSIFGINRGFTPTPERTDWMENHLRTYPEHIPHFRQTCLHAVRHGALAGERAAGWVGLCLTGVGDDELEIYELLHSRLQELSLKLALRSMAMDESNASLQRELPSEVWQELKAMSGWKPVTPSLHEKVRHLWWDSLPDSFPEKYFLLSRVEDDEWKLLNTACLSIPPGNFHLVLAGWHPQSPEVRNWVLKNIDRMKSPDRQGHLPLSVWQFLFSPACSGNRLVAEVRHALLDLPEEDQNHLFRLLPSIHFPPDTTPHNLRLLVEEFAHGAARRQNDAWDTVAVAFFLLTEYFRLEKDHLEKTHLPPRAPEPALDTSSGLEKEYAWLGGVIENIGFSGCSSLWFFEKTVQWAIHPNPSVTDPHLDMTVEIVLETAAFELARACDPGTLNNERIFRYLHGLIDLVNGNPDLVSRHQNLLFEEFWPRLCQIVKETSHPAVFWAAGVLGNELAEWQDMSRTNEWWQALTHRSRDIFLSIFPSDEQKPAMPSDLVDAGYPATINLSYLIRLDFLVSRIRFTLETMPGLSPCPSSGGRSCPPDEVTIIQHIKHLTRRFPERAGEYQYGWNTVWEHLNDVLKKNRSARDAEHGKAEHGKQGIEHNPVGSGKCPSIAPSLPEPNIPVGTSGPRQRSPRLSMG